ncbi:MAG: response regulator [Anaerolineae bacterium]
MNNSVEILIVEDSPAQAKHLKRLLEKHAYRVSVAHDGKEALAAIRQHRPTLVVSDIVMPRMDGFELCRRIKADESLKDLPVILLTQLSEPGDIIEGLECGADNFMTKPYDEPALLSRIQYILANQTLVASDVSNTQEGTTDGSVIDNSSFTTEVYRNERPTKNKRTTHQRVGGAAPTNRGSGRIRSRTRASRSGAAREQEPARAGL